MNSKSIWYFKNNIFRKYKVIKNEINTIYIKDEDKLIQLVKDDILEANDNSEKEILNINNLIKLIHLNQAEILNSIMLRYNNNIIYTNCSDLLLAVNPYQMFDIYNIKTMIDYHKEINKNPHVFQIGNNAFKKLKRNNKNQTILLSGISGSSKTFSATLIMKYLSYVSSNFEIKETGIQNKILNSNVILEAFGNSQTLLNSNSSRFGKFTKIIFDNEYKLIGASIDNYLLEKIRIVKQCNGERNYHIFYLILKGLFNKKKYKLKNASDYRYLNNLYIKRNDLVNDKDEYKKLIKCFKILNFSDEEVDEIIKLLSGILLLGELKINKVDKSIIEDNNFCDLLEILNIEKEIFLDSILYKKLIVDKKMFKTKISSINNLKFTIDGLAKSLYSGLFDWLVLKINEELGGVKIKNQKFIGILDIFGFEVFKKNGFEQICINYSNEVLQNQFNSYVFEKELEEYKKEQINFKNISFPNNIKCINLFKKKFFPTLNDIFQFEHKGNSDKIFYNNINKINSIYLNFNKKKAVNLEFSINHFAEIVNYTCNGFYSKNKDLLHSNIVNIYHNIKLKIFKNIKKIIIKKYSLDKKKIGQNTIIFNFEKQLKNLIKIINNTEVHYIRCLKPNDNDEANNFISYKIYEQLKYAGVLEAIKIARTGYSIRYNFNDFLLRYKLLFKLNFKNNKNFCELILKQFNNNFYQIGLTKIFLKKKIYNQLENLRFKKLNGSSITLQKYLRAFYFKKIFNKSVKNIIIIQNIYRKKKALNIFNKKIQNKNIIIIQKYFRTFYYYKKFKKFKFFVIFIQNLYRKKRALKILNKKIQNKNTIIIQKHFRTFYQYTKFKKIKFLIYNIQSLYRIKKAKNKLKLLKKNKKSFKILKTKYNKLKIENQKFKNKTNILLNKVNQLNNQIILKIINKHFYKKIVNKNNTFNNELNNKNKKIKFLNDELNNKNQIIKFVNDELNVKNQNIQNIQEQFKNKDKIIKNLKEKNTLINEKNILINVKNTLKPNNCQIKQNYNILKTNKEICLLKSKISSDKILLNKANNIINDLKCKLNSLENLILSENKIKNKLIKKLNNNFNYW